MTGIPLRAAIITSVLFAALGTAAPASAELSCGDLPDLTTLYFQKHIRFNQLTDQVRERTINHVIEFFDPQRVLFLDKDVVRLRGSLPRVFHEIRAGDCGALRQLHEEAVARNREVEGFVRGFVGRDDYALNEKVELLIDPAKRGYPKTKDTRDDLLRSLVHFQISNYVNADTSLEEARKRLIHRYELRTRRVAEIDREELYAIFLNSFANALDPHSSYLSRDFYEDFRIQMSLSLEGIGVALSEQDGFSVVEQIIPGGAADRVDVLQPKDRIIAVAEDGVDPVDIIDTALRDVVRLIRGEKGTRVHLTVLRQGEQPERFQVAIIRDKIDLEEGAAKLEIKSVQVGEQTLMLGVLDLPSFYGDGDSGERQGSRDVYRLLGEAKAKKVDGILLDLSRNGGGLLDDAVRISGFFIERGGVVAVRDSEDRSRVHRDPDKDIEYAGPLVLLTSRVSASASEILAGALKDYRRAVVVGDAHTFGKGSVQSMIPLPKGLGALKVTTALFFRPGGDSTQHGGVAADVVLPSLLTSDLVGESVHEHALRAASVDSFLAETALEHSAAWKPISDGLVSELQKRSSTRVEANPFFQEIHEKLAERAEDDGVLKLADLLAERETSQASAGGNGDVADAGSPALVPDEEEDAPTPHRDEALQVLADLVLLSR